MKLQRHNIGELEEIILLIVGVLGNDAYGISVKDEVKKQTGRVLTISAVHSVLLRLEKKGLLKSWVGGATQERGGRRKRFFYLTNSGREAITEVKQIRSKLWNLMPDFS